MDLKPILAAAEEVAKKYKSKGDSVRWSAWKADGTEVGGWKNSACYSTAMSILPELEIHCLPYGGPAKGQMPALWYHHFFRLLKQVGLAPPETKALHRKGAHCLIIPRTGWDRHTIYITLCYYRQTDQKPNEIMQAMLLYKKLAPHGTTFLQCLHYAAVTTKFGAGHYFMNVSPYGGIDKNDLRAGQALAWFAGLSKKERAKLQSGTKSEEKRPVWEKPSQYTCALLSKKVNDFEDKVRVGDVCEILDPQHAPLYQTPVSLEPRRAADENLAR